MSCLRLIPIVLLLVVCQPEVPPGEPVTFDFQRMCGPQQGRATAYDPKTRAFYLHVHDIARFSVKSVVANLDKQPIVLHISGMLDRPEGPLTMNVTQADGKTKEYRLNHRDFDKELFRIEREKDVTTVEFLPKGKALLKAGVGFQYIDFYRN